MPVHQVAFICSGVLVVPLALLQVLMRRQAHDANYGIGSREVNPWDVRYVNDLRGIWNAHKKAYERSVLRSAFIALFAAWSVSLLVTVLAWFDKL
ncbi:MAG TPA: hypothetical protein VFM77_19845 [Terriglobales bacterium]|nr:hypothetical protein [Terriglobales bacterium]